MTKDEALRLALEALQFALHVGFDESSGSQIKKGDKAGQQHRQAITAIKAALEAKDEPVGWIDSKGNMICTKINESCRPLYTTPQRTWVGLTDEDEIDWEEGGTLKDLVKAIEKKLKEKNGY